MITLMCSLGGYIKPKKEAFSMAKKKKKKK